MILTLYLESECEELVEYENGDGEEELPEGKYPQTTIVAATTGMHYR